MLIKLNYIIQNDYFDILEISYNLEISIQKTFNFYFHNKRNDDLALFNQLVAFPEFVKNPLDTLKKHLTT